MKTFTIFFFIEIKFSSVSDPDPDPVGSVSGNVDMDPGSAKN